MTERLSGLPTGLLRFARRIRHQNKDLRIHNYTWWMGAFNPRAHQRYLDLCEERKDKGGK